MTDKLKNGNTANRRGRPKGSVNKTTATAKAIIQATAEKIGGQERLTAWVLEAPENEKAFWTSIYPKLLPVQVHGAGENGEHTIVNKIVREIVRPANSDA